MREEEERLVDVSAQTDRTHDAKWMRRAIELAVRGRGRVEPNPMVGAAIVKDGRLVAEGYHERFGGPHAEVHAIRAAGDACRGATLYVTLSPCTGTHKKTPPCCDAVIQAGFARVVIGAIDTTRDSSVPRLAEAGMEVETGVLGDECERSIAPFMKLKTLGMPWVIAKWAMSADGKIATAAGDSKWISCEASRELVHQWRNEVDAILVGRGTVDADDPLLTCRLPDGRNPRRVILDSNASLSSDTQLVKTVDRAPVLVACLESAPEAARRRLADVGCDVLPLAASAGGVDLDALLKHLGSQQATNLLVEGGATVLGAFFDRGLVDEVRIFIAPKVIGGAEAPSPVAGHGIPGMDEAIRLEQMNVVTIEEDVLVTGLVR